MANVNEVPTGQIVWGLFGNVWAPCQPYYYKRQRRWRSWQKGTTVFNTTLVPTDWQPFDQPAHPYVMSARRLLDVV